MTLCLGDEGGVSDDDTAGEVTGADEATIKGNGCATGETTSGMMGAAMALAFGFALVRALVRAVAVLPEVALIFRGGLEPVAAFAESGLSAGASKAVRLDGGAMSLLTCGDCLMNG